MSASSYVRVGLFKSPVRVLAANLLRSRDTQADRARQKTQDIQHLKRELAQQQQLLARREQELQEMRQRIGKLTAENRHLRQQPPVLPDDPPLPQHQFGPKMIAVLVNLARAVGLRASVTCLQIVWDWLGVTARLPVWTTVRTWLMRLGVAALEEPVEQADDHIWMGDHSNQIGPEKALVIVGVRASQLPPPGVALRHEDMRVLAVQPGISWKREDMARAYQQLATKIGAPLAVIVDGAIELREGAEVLQDLRSDTVILSDFKHYAATVLKKIVGDTASFANFTAQVGSTRSSIQQTELGHLTPLGPRPKARFMNLAGMLKWAEMVSWQLAHPDSGGRQGITAARMEDKLGWLRSYRDNLSRWSACQRVVSTSVTFINQQGLFRGAADQLAAKLASMVFCEDSLNLANRLIDFVRQSEQKLRTDHRLPLSTEILESAFGLFKQLERQHSKGGFTSLLAAFGALLKPATAASVRRDFARVSVQQLRTWVTNNLKTTLASKRQKAYAESA